MPSRVPLLLLALALSLGVLVVQRLNLPSYTTTPQEAVPSCEHDVRVQRMVEQEQGKALAVLRIEHNGHPAPGWITATIEKLTEAFEPSTAAWRVSVIRSQAPNAFAGANREIVLTDGLLASGLSRQEISGVVAHEIAHVRLRHAIKRHCTEMREGSATSLYHAHELEADSQAKVILKNAGLNPSALRSALVKLSSTATQSKASATHPELKERLAQLSLSRE